MSRGPTPEKDKLYEEHLVYGRLQTPGTALLLRSLPFMENHYYPKRSSGFGLAEPSSLKQQVGKEKVN